MTSSKNRISIPISPISDPGSGDPMRHGNDACWTRGVLVRNAWAVKANLGNVMTMLIRIEWFGVAELPRRVFASRRVLSGEAGVYI